MTIALWCVFAASLLPVLSAGLAKASGKNFDNSNPRAWLANLPGWGARAHAAQQNSWEALIIFAAGVCVAHIADAPQDRVDAIAIAFIVARLLYIACYIANRATLRSLVWAIGFFLSLALYFQAPMRAAAGQ